MGKKNKSTASTRTDHPNTTELFQNQPAHNPYYPDPNVALLAPQPPPYSQSVMSSASVPMANTSAASNINYPRIHTNAHPGHASVIIQSSTYDHRAERYSRKVRSFNNQALLTAILAIVLSIWAYNLYDRRACVFDFTVVKPNKDVKISISDVRNAHLTIAHLSGFLLLLCLAKGAFGYSSKSHSCYLCLVGLFTLFMTMMTGYLAYLAFYSPCAPKIGELATNSLKTFFGSISDTLPSPDKGMFGESSIIAVAADDKNGLCIFLFDVVNFVMYFSLFVTSTVLC